MSGDNWHNSTVAGFEGWRWEGDTSSDEVVGHMFAYSVFAKAMNQSGQYAAEAAQLIHNIVTYIISNNFYLIDVTGLPTTWGVWNPTQLNLNRDFSDERSVFYIY